MAEPTLPEESIFARALEIESTSERAAFLDKACGDNAGLRAGVEALLRASQKTGDLLDLPEDDLRTTDLPSPEGPGMVIGPYKLLEQIGEGGMGTVWMAEQTEPIRRRVALKVIKEGMDSRQVLARFEAERQALALMEHPNIAKVLDAGKTPSGRPYFVMELVKGKPITVFCDEKRLTVRERLGLFGDVCRAVQHAHQKGIIHRDLKPSNVLIAPFDGKPVVKVIDFGVAKAAGQRLTDKTLFTGFGALVGTPEYMSPEQAEINNQDIDTRSDIYSLGVLLYELLTGSTPLTRKRIKEAALLEVLRVIREEEPPKPSTRLSESKESLPSVSAQRQTEPGKLTRLVRGELDWIVMKALDKDRNRRYETANGLAMDVQRYLADEPVHACPPSAGYRFRKLVRRNKAAMTMVAMFSMALLIAVAALSISTALTARAYDAEKVSHGRAEANFQRTRQAVHEFFTNVSQSKLLDVPGVQPVRQELLESAVRYYQDLAKERDDDPTIQADLALAHLRLAEVYYEVNDNNKAIASINAGLELAELLIQNHPGDRDLLRRLAGFCKATRRMSHYTADPDDLAAAERSLNRFIGIWQTLADQDPQERLFQSDLAALYLRLAEFFDLDQRRTEATVVAEKSAAMWGTLVRDYPREAEYLSAQADAFSILCYLSRLTGQHHRESEFAQKRFEASEKLAVLNPTAPPYREDVANGVSQQAGALRTQDKPAQAEKLYRQSLAIYEKLAKEYPMNGRYQRHVLITCGDLAALLKSMGQVDEAEHFHTRIAEILDKVVGLPAEPVEKSDLAELIRQIASSEEDTKSRERLLRLAHDINEKLIDHHPNISYYRIRLVWTHADLGKVVRQRPGGQQDAEKHFRAAAAIMEKLVSESPGNADYWQGLADRHWDLVDLLRANGQQKEIEEEYRRKIGFYEKLATRLREDRTHRGSLAVTCANLSMLLNSMGQANEADRFALRAVEGMKEAVAGSPATPEASRALAWECRELARRLQNAGQRERAEIALREAADIFARLSVDHPDNGEYLYFQADTHRLLGNVLAEMNRDEKAEIAFHNAVELFAKLPGGKWRAGTHNNVGDEMAGYTDLAKFLVSRKRLDDATEVSRQAIRFYAQYPQEVAYRDAVARGHHTLADTLAQRGQFQEAIEEFRDAIAGWEKLATDFRDIREFRMHVAFTYGHMARTMNESRQPEEAERALSKSVSLFEKLGAEFPAQAEYRKFQSQNLWELGTTHFALSQTREAEKAYRQAADVYEKLARDFPNETFYQQELGWTYFEFLGPLLEKTKQLQEAEQAYRKAVAIHEKLLAETRNMSYATRLSGCYGRLMSVLKTAGKAQDAEKVSRKVLEVYEELATANPKVLEYRREIAQLYFDFGEWEKAAAAYTKVMEMKPDDWDARVQRGRMYLQLQRWDMAVEDNSEAIKLKPAAWEAWFFRGFARSNQQRFDMALEDYTESLKLGPDAHAPRIHRAGLYSHLRQWDKSVDDYSELLKRYPDDYYALHDRAAAYVKLMQPEKAVADLRQAFAKGYKDLEGMKKDDRFAPLRDREDFKKLLAELEGKKKP